MLSQLFVAALLSSSVLAEQKKRQSDGGAQFSSAASQLVSAYVPQSAFAVLVPDIQAAASSAGVSYADPTVLVYSALLATSVPAWFNSAIPSAYSVQFASLEGDIGSLRADVTAAQATVPVVIPVTTTDSKGSTFTTSVTTSGVALTTATSVVTSGVPATITATTSPMTTIYTDSAGSIITSVFGAGASGASSVGSVGVSGASSVGSVVVSGASSVGSVAISGASSLFSPSSSTAKPGAAARPTALPAAAAGAMGLVGLMVAL